MGDFVKNCFDLSMELLSKLSEGNDGRNLIFSPYSIQSCVALAHAGAEGETSLEISKGLKFVSNDQLEVANSFAATFDSYNASDLVTIANKVYVQSGYTIKEKYMDLVKNKFHSEAEEINFSQNEVAAFSINQWVEKKTNGKIKDLVSPSNLNSLTRLVLLNAIHFKGSWEKKFNETRTVESDFWINAKTSVKVKMMNNKDKFQYGEFDDLKCKALELRYKDSELSMLIFLPNEREGLRNLATQLKSTNLTELTKRMYEEEVVVALPKFKVEFSCELNEPLKQMGVNKMFTPRAELFNIIQSAEILYVSDVIHKAFIEVNEEGVEAAAATGMVLSLCSFSSSLPIQFRAEHPFLYVIWDKKSILFLGAFVLPIKN